MVTPDATLSLSFSFCSLACFELYYFRLFFLPWLAFFGPLEHKTSFPLLLLLDLSLVVLPEVEISSLVFQQISFLRILEIFTTRAFQV
jgi:hypothetical protein